MENAFIVLTTIYIMVFVVHLIDGNMIGRQDGVRANSNYMIFLPAFIALLFFFSRRKKYNVWSTLAQAVTLLYLIFTLVVQFLNANVILNCYKPILVSFVIIHSILYVCLFIDIVIYDRKHHTRL